MAGLAPAPGRVVLVGAGPGDVELLTLKAARLIAEADWLVHDALVQPEVLALARHARVISVGKRAGNPSARQSSINRILLDCAHQGGLTVRLKGGDPLIFARAQEELDVLHAAGIPVEVVPGISSAQAAGDGRWYWPHRRCMRQISATRRWTWKQVLTHRQKKTCEQALTFIIWTQNSQWPACRVRLNTLPSGARMGRKVLWATTRKRVLTCINLPACRNMIT